MPNIYEMKMEGTSKRQRCHVRYYLRVQHHDVTRDDCQQTLRCLYYHGKTDVEASAGLWRAGAHTDFDTLTLLFQRPGECGELKPKLTAC